MKIFHIKAADATEEMERRFADLVEALAALGIRQYVIMSASPERQAQFDRIKVPYTIQKFSGLFDLRTLQAAQQIAESFGPHLIQTHTPDAVTLAAKIQFNTVRIGFAASDVAQHKRTLAASDIALSVAYPQQGAALDYDILPVPPLVQDLCPDGRPQPKTSDEKPVIGCMLDASDIYRIEPVLQAIRDISGIHLHICGRGPALESWQNAAKRQAIHDRTFFTEHCDNAQQFLTGLDLCIVPHRSGGTDRLTLETWSCGTCVLSGMPPERSPIEHESNGYLIDGNNVLAWRENIKSLLQNNALRTQLGKAGRESYMASHQASRAISSYLQAYETALRLKA